MTAYLLSNGVFNVNGTKTDKTSALPPELIEQWRKYVNVSEDASGNEVNNLLYFNCLFSLIMKTFHAY